MFVYFVVVDIGLYILFVYCIFLTVLMSIIYTVRHTKGFDPLGWRGGLVVGRRTCDLVVAGSSPGRGAAA